MSKISTLGPKGTFSEVACNKYLKSTSKEHEIYFYPSISKAFNAIGKDCDLGIIPIENTLDGHVQLCLDLLSNTDLKITHELVVPVQFALVANVDDITQITTLYCQFKAQGQCSNFIEQLSNTKIITTESNSSSYDEAKKSVYGEAAIIPIHLLNINDKFKLTIDNVTDSLENETRFIILSNDLANYNASMAYKTSLVIQNPLDKPGSLSTILQEFSQNNINLKSIMSQPTKETIGRYSFFIDIDGNYPHDEVIKKVLDSISETYSVKILGSYSRI